MAQWLRVLAVLLDYTGSIPSTFWQLTAFCNSSSRRLGTQVVCKHLSRQNTHKHFTFRSGKAGSEGLTARTVNTLLQVNEGQSVFGPGLGLGLMGFVVVLIFVCFVLRRVSCSLAVSENVLELLILLSASWMYRDCKHAASHLASDSGFLLHLKTQQHEAQACVASHRLI